jgi:hypothetical protein
MNKRFNLFLPLLIVVLIALISFVIFKYLYDVTYSTEYSKELIAAFLGVILTGSLTSVLLKHQSISETEKEKTVAIFDAKLEHYNEFVEFLCSSLMDQKTPNTIDRFEEITFKKHALKISLISGEEVAQSIDKFFLQFHKFRKLTWDDLTREEQKSFLSWYKKTYNKSDVTKKDFFSIGDLIYHMKHDLGEKDISRLKDIEGSKKVIDHILKY